MMRPRAARTHWAYCTLEVLEGAIMTVIKQGSGFERPPSQTRSARWVRYHRSKKTQSQSATQSACQMLCPVTAAAAARKRKSGEIADTLDFALSDKLAAEAAVAIKIASSFCLCVRVRILSDAVVVGLDGRTNDAFTMTDRDRRRGRQARPALDGVSSERQPWQGQEELRVGGPGRIKPRALGAVGVNGDEISPLWCIAARASERLATDCEA
ncbi:hypothetical protein MPTK1_7g06840 [Marchantia polymorpha subsp. ruderalis]|uniref:Uncharacterized protein n=2 Tax=Marchantia polymorpha TaxID=3197 RepID=A0AAF6BWW4_MARPO|nr:hypothetical protein MARPO_0199s0007 [Marchantia polymorpha]BBN16498.1 hypothetical protein Mp_7g06840 [Marchantia polymorpha subsp. ruderalis]|eukprot:PTQ27417.1 hypothetical protein MARPO_0199s0007 [Marchantia polymorpha]